MADRIWAILDWISERLIRITGYELPDRGDGEPTDSAPRRRVPLTMWGRAWRAGLLSVSTLVLGSTFGLTTAAVEPDAADAQCVPVPGAPCLPDGSDVTAAVSPIVAPVVDSIAGAADGLFIGSMEHIAADLLASGVEGLEFIWYAFADTITPNFEILDPVYRPLQGVAVSLMVLFFLLALVPEIRKLSPRQAIDVVWRVGAAIIGLGVTRPVAEIITTMTRQLGNGLFEISNQQLQEWADGPAASLTVAVGTVGWPWLMGFGALFSLSVFSVGAALQGSLVVIYMTVMMSPLLWAFWVLPATRAYATGAFRLFLSAAMAPIVIAAGIVLLASHLAAPLNAEDPWAGLSAFALAGVILLTLSFSPFAIWSLSGIDVSGMTAGRQAVSGPEDTLKTAAGVAGAAAGGSIAAGALSAGGMGGLANILGGGSSGGGGSNGSAPAGGSSPNGAGPSGGGGPVAAIDAAKAGGFGPGSPPPEGPFTPPDNTPGTPQGARSPLQRLDVSVANGAGHRTVSYGDRTIGEVWQVGEHEWHAQTAGPDRAVFNDGGSVQEAVRWVGLQDTTVASDYQRHIGDRTP